MSRVYSDIDKSELLIEVARLDGSTRKASSATGIPRRTLEKWWNALNEDQRQEYLLIAKKRQEAWWQELHDSCLQVARAKIEDMSPRDALIGAGIAFDKLRLIRGEATDISSTVSTDAESLAREVESILSRVAVEAPKEARERQD